jgi:Zn-dependent peptidase ImmA (M78 family)
MSVGHELGHLVLHKSPRGNLSDLEKQAYSFAREFLLPKEAMKREIKRPVTLTGLATLKPRWGVSIQALIRCAYELEISSEAQYRYFAEQVSKLGWRKREPENLDIPTEKPRLLRKLAEMTAGVPPNAKRIASFVCSNVSLIEDVLAVHASKGDLPPSEKNRLTEVIEDQNPIERPDNLLRFRQN